MATIKDVACEAEVSLGTVSNVLNGKDSVKAENREKVFKAMKKLGFHYNMLASSLRTKSTKNIGLIIPTIINPYYPELVRGVEDEAMKDGITVFLCNSDRQAEKEQKYIEALLSKGVDGIILLKPQMSREDLVKLEEQTTLVVQDWEMENNEETFPVVNVNDNVGVVQGMNFLHQYGHRRIAFISGVLESYSGRCRLKAYERCLESWGIPYRSEYIIFSDYSSNGGYEAAKTFMKLNPRPTAIFAANDMMAMGAMKAIQANGFRIPEDISVMGYDDIEMGKLCTPSLTTIHQPQYEIGVMAYKLLRQRMMKEEIPEDKRRILLETRIVQRDSVGFICER